MKNDLSLLRPFDLEKAKAGHPICTRDGRKARFIAHVPEADEGYRVFVLVEGAQCASSRFESGAGRGNGPAQPDIMLAPLCWVEGKPVYPGATLRRRDNGWSVTALQEGYQDEVGNWLVPDDLTWTPPPVKREGWVNVYPGSVVGGIYASEKRANDGAQADRLACIRIEWEEPQ